MRLLGPTPYHRLNEVVGFVFLVIAAGLTLALASYHPTDPSWNTASPGPPTNLIGLWGARIADLLYQGLGAAAALIPLWILWLGWSWVRSAPIRQPFRKLAGFALLLSMAASALALIRQWLLFGVLPGGGLVGILLSDWMLQQFNLAGSVLVISTGFLTAAYLSTARFSISGLLGTVGTNLGGLFRRGPTRSSRQKKGQAGRGSVTFAEPPAAQSPSSADIPMERLPEPGLVSPKSQDPQGDEHAVNDDIPIWSHQQSGSGCGELVPVEPTGLYVPPLEEVTDDFTLPTKRSKPAFYQLPSTALLNQPAEKAGYDERELNEIAAAIKRKLEEFNVFGSVVQINHGPVVTTFEFQPDAGIKYSRITSLRDDLCLGLQAESILIERIPGKSTVGIEVPNTRREVISLREILESTEFRRIRSRLPIPLGKDVRGRIRVEALESMPHLLIAGSTGSGKSVMLNSIVVSVLYKSTPDQVRMILIDPKRVELGIYEGLPHLLTPVVTDARQATNVLRNAVMEMENRFKLLAALRVRNIEEYNEKLSQQSQRQRELFSDDGQEFPPLPYILILIDELSDLMIVERANVEGAITRLAQMARAVGMHLVVATQRPSVDVITGLIKANFPARISFRVATRVDSRTILDTMGAEHLLGRGDMLFLPPGSARLVRVHGPLVTENEITRVVEHWKSQAEPEYDESFLQPPPSEDAEPDESAAASDDPLYPDAVRVVVEVGKASTSILQRRLRLGYGRAARLLDAMEKEGIIGPACGSRPREVLRVPDWLNETVS